MRSEDGAAPAPHGAVEERTEGGDPVCWLERVCDECGAMREDMASAVCVRCGTPFPTPGDAPGGPSGG
jgi:hypothetical protein